MTSAATALPQPAPRPPARASQWFYRGLRKLARLTGGGWDVRGHVIIAVPLDRLRVPQRRGRGGLQVRWLTPEDCPALDQLRPASGKPYAHRFAEAHRAVGAFLSPAPGQAPRLLAFCWVLRGPARLPTSFGCAWDLPASVAWLYDLYSDPSVLGAVSHLYLYIQEHPPGPGLLYLAGQNDFENARSRMAHLSLGFERLATVWSLKAGPWWHCSHGGNGWRAYGPEAAIPVAWLTPAPGARVALAPPVGFGNELWLQCGCGERVGLGDQPLVCRACGRKLGAWRQGFADVGPPLPYWGEIPQPDMEALLRRGEQAGWRRAVEELLTPELCEYVAAPARAAFQELLPLATGARILDLGAGWGSIAAPLARRYEVVALEGVAERARFIALRKQQEGLEHLTVVRGRIQEARFGPAQFDVVIANGVLEWSALDDLRDEPRRVQVRCLERMRELLCPGGYIYVGIENRFGRAMLAGGYDHSGLRFTSVMPRFLAQAVCRRHSPGYRASTNVGYRTYTYSHRGYVRLFAEAGLRVHNAWISPRGYNRPATLVPMLTPAIRFADARRRRPWPASWRHAVASRGWAWRWLGSDFVYLLQADRAPARAAATHGCETGHASA